MAAPARRGYPAAMAHLDFLTDPREFLAAAGDHLAAQPVVSTVVSTVAHTKVLDAEERHPHRADDWWLVVRDDAGQVLGVGMRTAPFAPRPAYLLSMPEDAAEAVAVALYERGEELTAVNGALPAVQACATRLARLTGGSTAVAQHTRLFQLGELVRPRPVPGRLRRAGVEELDLAVAWFRAFMLDADTQAGREPGATEHFAGADDVLRRIETGRIWFWEDEDAEVVHLTGSNPPSLGVARIGPVYTPPEHRGRGLASAAVAEVSRRILAAGARACLFTDQANPTSNHVYTALGYRPVVDMANLRVVPAGLTPPAGASSA